MQDPLPFDPIAEARRQWHRRWPDGPLSAMAAVTSIARAHQILIGRCNHALRPWDLTFARYEALMLLLFSARGALPLARMGERLQVHPTSITNLVDGLEKLGYAIRTAHPSDRRTTLASLTASGRTVATEATAALHAIEFGFADTGLNPGSLDDLVAILRQMRARSGDFLDS